MLALRDFFAAAARLVEGGEVSDPALHEAASRLVAALGPCADSADAAARARLLRVGTLLEDLFELPHPHGAEFRCFGALAHPARVATAMADETPYAVGGSGLSVRAALDSCLGEAAEYLSQVRDAPAVALRADLAGLEPPLPAPWHATLTAQLGGGAADFILAQALDGDAPPLAVPVDLCFRRPSRARDFVPATPLSTGCAAGVSLAAARLRAVLELVERDAAARWWRGGSAARALPLDGAVNGRMAALIGRLRPADHGRRTLLLDIAADPGIPVIAAIGLEDDGTGFACGLAARLATADAAEAALLEMAQSETALALARTKLRAHGAAALSVVDRNHLRRGERLSGAALRAIRPQGWGELRAESVASDAEGLDRVLERLRARGLVAWSVELTTGRVGIPVARVIVPGLHPEPSGFELPPLRRLREANGMTDAANAVPLLG